MASPSELQYKTYFVPQTMALTCDVLWSDLFEAILTRLVFLIPR